MPAILLAGGLGAQMDAIFANFDMSIFTILGNIQNDILTLIAEMFTSLGDELYVIPFAVLGLIMCFFKRTRRVGFTIVIAVIIGTLITNIIVKPLFLRVRPYNTLQGNAEYWSWYVGAHMLSESDYCFPSGHTTGVTETAIGLMLCHIASKRKAAKAAAWIFPIVTFIAGCSRVYLMVHYATDVIAGWIVGIIAAVLGFVLSGIICRKIFRKDDTPETARAMKKNIRPGAVLMIALCFLVIWTTSFMRTLSDGGSASTRCSYSGEYNCQNEVDEKDKYLGSDGNYYCKLHIDEFK